MSILITGSAGYIGSYFTKKITAKFKNINFIAIDNINNYYDKKVKYFRLKNLKKIKNLKFIKLDIKNKLKLDSLFKKYLFKEVYHFAAQAGVRYSEINPQAYVDSNITGFINILDASKKFNIKKFFYSSSSSVYGDYKNAPFKEEDDLKPKSLYALSKKFNEDLAKIYFENYKFKSVGLRFFTVIGESGRPDMLINKYLNASFNKKKFYLNNYGRGERDFTYVHDVVDIILKLRNKYIKKNEVFNICGNKTTKIQSVLKFLENEAPKLNIIHRKMNKLDVLKTHGNNSRLKKKIEKFKFTKSNKSLLTTIKWYFNNHKLLK
tara:strand:+ start:2037 stop:2999 length:963 start_codon:yes stop_codon:yes gene_type:complete